MKHPVWLGAGLIGLAGLGLAMHLLSHRGEGAVPRAPQPVPVHAGMAVSRAVPEQIEAIGTVQAYNTVAVKPQVDGRITHVDFAQGQTVTPGETLFEIDPRPYRAALDQAEATEARDAATLKGAEDDLLRYHALVTKHYTATKTYQDQRVKVDELKATVRLDRAAVESAKLDLDYTTIRAPLGGRTGAILVNQGNIVRASLGPTLVTIAQIRPVRVSFAVPQGDLPAIRQHQAAGDLRVVALDARSGGELAAGRLSFIDNAIDAGTGTVMLMGTFPNRRERLWPGEYVTARLTLAIQQDALTVPESAIVEGPDGDYVYVIGADDRVSRRAVTVTRRHDGFAIIGKGLAKGARIVIDGQFRLDNGARVTIERAAAPDAAGRRT